MFLLKAINQWINERYGGKRGLVLTIWHRLLFISGFYQTYHNISLNNVDRLIFVCKGNICRSPFAEYVARNKGLRSISCGTDAGYLASANANAIEAAKKKYIDMSGHKSRSANTLRITKCDLFVVMEPKQGEFVKNLYGKQVPCILLGLWHKPSLPYLHDPYGQVPKYFDRCFDIIEEAIEGIMSEIKKTKYNCNH